MHLRIYTSGYVSDVPNAAAAFGYGCEVVEAALEVALLSVHAGLEGCLEADLYSDATTVRRVVVDCTRLEPGIHEDLRLDVRG